MAHERDSRRFILFADIFSADRAIFTLFRILAAPGSIRLVAVSVRALFLTADGWCILV